MFSLGDVSQEVTVFISKCFLPSHLGFPFFSLPSPLTDSTNSPRFSGASFAVGSREVSSCCLSLATAVLGRSQVDGRGWGWKGDLTSLLFYEKRPSVVPYELSDLIRGPGTLGCLSDNFSSQKSG